MIIMPKPPFVHFPGALYHITARGNNQEKIFLQSKDYEKYLKRIKEVKEKFPLKLYAYCFMPNHVHLLVEAKKVPVSRIMQALQTGHAMYFNKKYNHLGHVFQGRYFWFLVEKENYLLELLRYIHLNPVRAKIVDEVEDYLWSSYREYISGEKKPLVEKKEILEYFSGSPVKAVGKFKGFIQAGIGVKREDIFSEVVRESFLGSTKFVSRLENEALNGVNRG